MAKMSYANVRDFVLRKAGGDCSLNADDIDILLISSLISVYNRLGNEGDTVSSGSIFTEANEASYDLPAEVDRVGTIEVAATGRLLRAVSPQEALAGVDYPSYYVQPDSTGEQRITLIPTPVEDDTEYIVRGPCDVNTTLYDTVDDVQVWRWVALPEQLHQYYAYYVLGQAVMDDDPLRGQRWMAIAEQELAAWKQAQQRLVRPKHTPLIFGHRADDSAYDYV